MRTIILEDIDFSKAFIGYAAIETPEGCENRTILDHEKMIDILLENKDQIDDVKNEDDAEDFITEMQTQYWFDEDFILKFDFEPVGE